MHMFDRDIAVTEEVAGLFKATVAANWSINGTPNGGYLMALIANAMWQSSSKKGNPIITANFITRSEPGEAEIHVERISQSNQFDRFEARLIQSGRERIRAFGTFGIENDTSDEKRLERGEPSVAQLADCVAVPEMPNYTLFSRMDVRLDPSSAGWMSGSVVDKSEMKGWIRFKEERFLDLFGALLMADSFPPAILVSHGMVAWVPTIQCSVSIRNLPRTKWLKCFFRTCFVNNGMLEEDGEMWDENGDLVGISRQYAQIRMSAG